MLNGMAIITGLVPAILAIVAVIILGKYPIPPQVRADMQKVLAEKETTEE